MGLFDDIWRTFFGGRQWAGYLVEIRLQGPVKKYTRKLIYDVARNFHLRGMVRKRPVPHITLYGPFSTNNTHRLIATFKEVCEKYAVYDNPREELIPLNIAGFKAFNGTSGKVICLDIQPSQRLQHLSEELCSRLNDFCKGQLWDSQKDKIFHATIAFKDVGAKHNAVLNYLNRKPVPKTKFPLIRITLLGHRGRIMAEYDLIQRRLLNRDEARSSEVFHTSISKVKRMLEMGKIPAQKP